MGVHDILFKRDEYRFRFSELVFNQTYIIGAISRAVFKAVTHIREWRMLQVIPQRRDKLIRKLISQPRSVRERRS